MEKVAPEGKEIEETTDVGSDGAPEYVVTSVRLPRDLMDAVDDLAARDHRSRSSMMLKLLTEALELRKIRGGV